MELEKCAYEQLRGQIGRDVTESGAAMCFRKSFPCSVVPAGPQLTTVLAQQTLVGYVRRRKRNLVLALIHSRVDLAG